MISTVSLDASYFLLCRVLNWWSTVAFASHNDSSTRGAFSGNVFEVALLIDIRIDKTSSSTMAVCNMTMVIRNGPTDVSKSINCSSSALCLAAVFKVAGQLIYP